MVANSAKCIIQRAHNISLYYVGSCLPNAMVGLKIPATKDKNTYDLLEKNIRYGVVITRWIFSKFLGEENPITLPLGRYMGRLLCIQIPIYIPHSSLQRCMQHHAIVDRVIAALDCILCNSMTFAILPNWTCSNQREIDKCSFAISCLGRCP